MECCLFCVIRLAVWLPENAIPSWRCQDGLFGPDACLAHGAFVEFAPEVGLAAAHGAVVTDVVDGGAAMPPVHGARVDGWTNVILGAEPVEDLGCEPM